MSAAADEPLMRCHISYIENYSPDFEACAKFAHQRFRESGIPSTLLTDAGQTWFWGPEVRAARQIAAPPEVDIDTREIVLHHAHGSHLAFQVWEKDASNAHLLAEVETLSPGSRKARYLWLVSCGVMQHGRLPAQPHLFDGHPSGKNVFKRWGMTYEESGHSWSPLANGVRQVCGNSTYIKPHKNLLAPVFRLRELGISVADAFVLGQSSRTLTSLCATRGSSIAANPLYDEAWNSAANPGGDWIFIQYPIWREPGTPIQPGLTSYLPATSNGEDETGFNSLPGSLPVLPLRIDEEWQDRFADLASGVENLPNVYATHQEATGSFRLQIDHNDSGPPASIDILNGLLQRALARPIDTGATVEQTHRIDFVEMRIDGFHLDHLNAFQDGTFSRDLLIERTKERYTIARPVLKIDGSPNLEIPLLDPDIGPLLRLSGPGNLPAEPSSDTENSIGKKSLLVRGWAWEKELEMAELIGERQAESRAWQSIEASPSVDPELVDRDHVQVAIGYRLREDDSRPGFLAPHYIVSYRSALEDGQPIATIEVPGIEGLL